MNQRITTKTQVLFITLVLLGLTIQSEAFSRTGGLLEDGLGQTLPSQLPAGAGFPRTCRTQPRGSTSCTSCNIGQTRRRKANTLYYGCYTCLFGCQDCDASIKTCTTCYSGKYNYKGISCNSCKVSNCKTCSSSDFGATCSVCVLGFYVKDSKTCAPCMANCGVCKNGTTCDGCNAFYEWDSKTSTCKHVGLLATILLTILYITIPICICLCICACICFCPKRQTAYVGGPVGGNYYAPTQPVVVETYTEEVVY